jgi:acetyltransferase-like isoleucine patch superfamily enzyme
LIFLDTIRDVNCGTGVRIIEPANVYECTLGDGCFVGPFVEIQKGVVIGARTRVQSHAFICELVTIGSDCFSGHGVMFINDVFAIGGPARRRRELWKHTRIGNGVSIGANATLMPVTSATTWSSAPARSSRATSPNPEFTRAIRPA